jgi:sugar lactone lactonase YvrE
VYEPDGRLLGILAMPKRPSNLNWIGHEGRSLAITMVDEVHEYPLLTQGLLPPFLPAS